jgi:hypothetical protein
MLSASGTTVSIWQRAAGIVHRGNPLMERRSAKITTELSRNTG